MRQWRWLRRSSLCWILKFNTSEAKSFIRETAASLILISQVNRFNRLNFVLWNYVLLHQTSLIILLISVFLSAGNKLTEQSLKLFLSSLENQGDGGLQRLSLNVSIITLFIFFFFDVVWADVILCKLCILEESLLHKVWHLLENTGIDVS